MHDLGMVLARFFVVLIIRVTGVGHVTLGSLVLPLLDKLSAGSTPGTWLGSRRVTRTPKRVNRSILFVLLAGAGSKPVLI